MAGTPRAKSLPALMAAAVALTEAVPAIAQTGLEGLQDTYIQFSHYRENYSEVWQGVNGQQNAADPLRVDSLNIDTGIGFTDSTSLDIQLTQDTWSGATPFITTPEGFIDTTTGASAFIAADKSAAAARVDRHTLTPLNLRGTPLHPDAKTVNLMTSASAETRNAADFTLHHEMELGGIDLVTGLSNEPDYCAFSLGLGGRLDLNSKLTSISAQLRETRSAIDADLGPVNAFVDYGMYVGANNHDARIETESASGLSGGLPSDDVAIAHFKGDRRDHVATVGVSRIVERNTTVSAGLTYTHSDGFLESPHKLVLMGFANPATPPFFNYLFTSLFTLPENRPDIHNVSALNITLARYVPVVDAALHVDVAKTRDDWGIDSTAVEARWIQSMGRHWTFTPQLRYYTQDAADFYQPYFVFRQAYPQNPLHADQLDFSNMPVRHWSSDQRLAAFDARSAGIVASYRFDNDMSLDLGYEQYRHTGGGGEHFADYRGEMFNVGLNYRYDDSTKPVPVSGHHTDAVTHAHHANESVPAPAGVMHAHLLHEAGSGMVEYSAHYAVQQGHMMHGASRATDASIVAACGSAGCPSAPENMTMQMHMLHLMYAPTERINLMLMPQWMSMTMENRLLDGGFYTQVGGHNHDNMDLSGHSSGGMGDTIAGVQVQLWRQAVRELHGGIGISIPTGEVDGRMYSHGGEYMDYGMQTGSGTWDALPDITYTQRLDSQWSWGVQLNSVIRTGGRNDSGYQLGDVVQATSWLNYQLSPHVTYSLRGVYTRQQGIDGELRGTTAVTDAFGQVSYPRPQHNSTDIASNYGGCYTDVGLGVTFTLPGREMQGDSLSLEWQEPVKDNLDGYQLARQGSVSLSWKIHF